ncbi:DNA starvation/stationary phase protection protein Dps [Fimbriiglobus ruber]|uniref:Non-specific DNA-binding protein Dps / Iron-binding ferritin-like antioxidant protein / Ferroxidase n=1 Tax=Fimbriiglobus ruber TaxID=1908690 RepID=A0A225DSB5_9BACT|nr:DNA starvation/stationary phase protection protein Dps [Fimbriiglobus ruber]OWK43953.1 Non-specific DNA-binding protein Dps / Iron-binding ferritin-like antioxidant protein / Ferroxidase [Fimbriiglobus ruber]
MATKSFPTRNDLSAEVRAKSVDLLNQFLADYIDLYTQIKHAHWNIKGPHFIMLHELFDDLAEEVEEGIDTVAERATALGGVAKGTARLASAASKLPEFPIDTHTDLAVVDVLVARFAHAAKFARAAIEEADKFGDKGTSDLFTGLSRELDKSLWFLESHLQK